MDKVFTFQVSEPQAQTIWNALMELPGKIGFPTAQAVYQQLAGQGAFGAVPVPVPVAGEKEA